MIFRIQYTDQADRQVKINANLGKFLIEEDNITEGNFLTFSDVKPIEVVLEILTDKVSTNQSAIDYILMNF